MPDRNKVLRFKSRTRRKISKLAQAYSNNLVREWSGRGAKPFAPVDPATSIFAFRIRSGSPAPRRSDRAAGAIGEGLARRVTLAFNPDYEPHARCRELRHALAADFTPDHARSRT
ncbi:MAG: hypothetical protein PVF93_03800 [Chromatiaceae bacterium]|jgi:hypothetical protein